MVSVGDPAELKGDVGNGVVLLHLEDGDPVEPTAVDGGEGSIIVVGRGGEVSAEGVDDGVGCSELAAKPSQYGILGDRVGEEHWGRGHGGSIGG